MQPRQDLLVWDQKLSSSVIPLKLETIKAWKYKYNKNCVVCIISQDLLWNKQIQDNSLALCICVLTSLEEVNQESKS